MIELKLEFDLIFHQHRWSQFHFVAEKKSRTLFEQTKSPIVPKRYVSELKSENKRCKARTAPLTQNSYAIWLWSKWGSKLTYFSNVVTSHLLSQR